MLFRIRGVAVFVHGSLPLVVIALSILAIVKSGFPLGAGLAYLFLIVIHELGHALVARTCGLKVHALTFFAFGGLCRNDAPKTYLSAFAVVSAGLAAQFLVLVAALAYMRAIDDPMMGFTNPVTLVFAYMNIFIIVLNLIPEKRPGAYGTDGYLLWKVLSRWIARKPFSYPDTSITFAPDTRLLRLRDFRPDGFSSGIEVLNDNTTPMEFVVRMLVNHLQVSRDDAVRLMVSIHVRGGLLLPLEAGRAEAVAAAIMADAAAASQPLVCRAAIAEPSPPADPGRGSVRLARREDAGRLAKLAETTFRDTFGAANSAEDMDLHCAKSYGESIQAAEIEDVARVTLVIEARGELVAFAQLRWSERPACVSATIPGEIQRFYVVRQWHGMGLAQQLMHAAGTWFAARGTDVVWLGVWERNLRAIAFYRKIGFAEVGEHVFPVGSDPQRDIIMSRSLSQ